MHVFVTGGTGYVGYQIVRTLVERGHSVTLLQRPGTARPTPHPVEIVEGDLFSPDSLRLGLDHAQAVIHLVGIIREKPSRGVTMERIHQEGTRKIVEAAEAAGVHRFIHMSALGARPEAVSKYHRSKWAAEEIVRESGLQYTIFRPSVIYGAGGPGPEFLGQLADLIRSGPVTPVIGDGNFLLQPVSVHTVAAAFVNSLSESVSHNKTYELGGAEVVSYRRILDMLANTEGKALRPVRVPVWLMKLLVNAFSRYSWFPLTQDQLTMLLEGNVCIDSKTAAEELHLSLQPFHLNTVSSTS